MTSNRSIEICVGFLETPFPYNKTDIPLWTRDIDAHLRFNNIDAIKQINGLSSTLQTRQLKNFIRVGALLISSTHIISQENSFRVLLLHRSMELCSSNEVVFISLLITCATSQKTLSEVRGDQTMEDVKTE